MLIPFEFIAWCLVSVSMLLRRCVWHSWAAPFPGRLLELDHRPPHWQWPRQRPGLRVQWHSRGEGPRWRRFRQPQGAFYDLCVDEARAVWQEEGDGPLQLRQNRWVSFAVRGARCSGAWRWAPYSNPKGSHTLLVTHVVLCSRHCAGLWAFVSFTQWIGPLFSVKAKRLFS